VSVETAGALDAVVERDPLVLVEFYTEGCGICASQAPVLTGVARTGDATVVTCNPRDDPELIERYAVSSVPTFLLFREGEPVARRADGFQSVEDLLAFVDANRDGLGADRKSA
jgi:thiol-disulfide isomerase/thioredoxin